MRPRSAPSPRQQLSAGIDVTVPEAGGASVLLITPAGA